MKVYQRVSFVLGIMVFLTLSSSSVFAAKQKFSQSMSDALKGVYFAVEELNPEIERDGLTTNQIKGDVEQRLGLAGIKVLSEEEWKKEKGSPYLYVNAHIMKVMNGVYVFNISTAFIQEVHLVRSSHIKVPASIWSAETLGISDQLRDIRKPTKDCVDKFIHEYLSMNPK
jgi:hypothetical protein